MRSKEQIAADVEAAESVIKSAQAAIVQATAAATGTNLGANFPDIANIPMDITLPDGRSITLGQLAAEIREL